jgi:hypothetical protein
VPKSRPQNQFVIPTGEIMGLRPTQGDENRLKGTAFRPSVTITITVALATEGNIFDRAQRSGPAVFFPSREFSQHPL